MLKILHFIPTLQQGGAENILCQITQKEIAEHHIITIFKEEIAFQHNGQAMSLDAPKSLLLLLLFFPYLCIKTLRKIKAINPDVCHGWLYMGCLFSCLAKLSETPVFWDIHSTYVDKKSVQIMQRACSLLSKIPQKIIYCGFSVKNFHEESLKFSPKNAVVSTNGVSSGTYTVNANIRDEGRSFLEKCRTAPITDTTKIILSLSRFDPLKDFDNMLHTLRLTKDAGHSDSVLVIAGRECLYDNPVFQALMKKYQLDKNDVVLLGFYKNTNLLLNAADIYISSSYSEAAPLTLIEALSVGIPVVSTDVGDCRALTSDYGFIAPPRDPQSLSQQLNLAINALENKAFNKKSCLSYASRYSLESKANDYRTWHTTHSKFHTTS